MSPRFLRRGAALALALLLPAAVATASSAATPSRSRGEASPPWQLVAPHPYPAWGNAGATTDGCTFLSIGGQDDTGAARREVRSYNPGTDAWSNRASMPEGRFGLTAATVGTKVYVFGGYRADLTIGDNNYIYDAATNTWTQGAPVPTGSGIATAAEAAVSGRVYLIGGDDGDLNSNTETFQYTPTTDTWRPRAPMPTGRENNMAVVYRGKIYVAGGVQVQVSLDGLTTFESYDPSTNTWATLAPMLQPRISPGMATDGRFIYVFGGSTSYSGGQDLRTTERYNPATNTWTRLNANMVTAVNAPASGFVAGRLISAAGSNIDPTQTLVLRPDPCA
jgi:N-acetylneuraminic acid mutarotase